jgi:MFS family permease
MELVTIAWLFGAVWNVGVSGAPFTVFASALGATPFQFGLLAAFPFITALCSMPAAIWIDASGARERIFLIAMLTQRFMWWGIALVPLVLLRDPTPFNRQLALFVFLGMFAITQLCQAIGGPAWVSWMADLVPEPIRGRYFARRRQLGTITAVPTALLAGLLLDHFTRSADPSMAIWWCSILFVVVTAFGVVDIVLFFWVPPIRHARVSHVPIWHTLVRPLKDKHYLWFCAYVATLIAAVAPMGQFTNLYLTEHLGISATQVQLMLLVTPLLGQAFIVPLWGQMADRYGRKPMLAIATLGMVPVGLGWCVMGAGYTWLGYLLSIVGSMLWAAVEIANFNLVIAMSGTRGTDAGEAGGGTGYNSVNSVALAIGGTLGGLGAGWLMSATRDVKFTMGLDLDQPFGSYEILFAFSALLRLLAAVVFLPKLHEPEARSTKDAVEFLADNLYDNVKGLIPAPVRRFMKRWP